MFNQIVFNVTWAHKNISNHLFYMVGDEPCIRYTLCKVPTWSYMKEIVINSSLFPGFSVCHKDVSGVCVCRSF